jgi:antibiotic biosynthesis monooxygenase (ABM) superfamily enzyme
MWAQIIKTRIKPGKEAELALLEDQFKAAEQPGSGLLRSTTMRDQKDPSVLYMMVVFESEEQARIRERDPQRQELLAPAFTTMGQIFQGDPEFIDLDVITDSVF